jgi:hypothetical protein
MNDPGFLFQCWLNLYWENEYFIHFNPLDYDAMAENEVIYRKLTRLIPQSHYDEINLIVYGIRRV